MICHSEERSSWFMTSIINALIEYVVPTRLTSFELTFCCTLGGYHPTPKISEGSNIMSFKSCLYALYLCDFTTHIFLLMTFYLLLVSGWIFSAKTTF